MSSKSTQLLGTLPVVCLYEFDDDGAWVEAVQIGEVEIECHAFSDQQLGEWAREIERELLAEAEQHRAERRADAWADRRAA